MSPELCLHRAEWEQGELFKEKGHTNPNEPQCLTENKISRAANCSLKGKCDLQMLTEQRAVPLLPPALCHYSDSCSSPVGSPDTFWESVDGMQALAHPTVWLKFRDRAHSAHPQPFCLSSQTHSVQCSSHSYTAHPVCTRAHLQIFQFTSL